jgi:hypothetical protein
MIENVIELSMWWFAFIFSIKYITSSISEWEIEYYDSESYDFPKFLKE